MLGSTIKSVEDDRINSAIAIKEKFGGTVLLKGNKSVIVIEDKIYICNHGINLWELQEWVIVCRVF